MLRSDPWDKRTITLAHSLWFEHCLAVHELSEAWIQTLKPVISPDSATVALPRLQSLLKEQEVEALTTLLKEPTLAMFENSLYHAYPEELLEQIQIHVNATLAWVLKTAILKTPAQEQPALKNILEQTSWRAGRAYQQKKNLTRPNRTDLDSVIGRLDLLPLVQPLPTLQNSHWPKAFLRKRILENFADLEWLACPHVTSQDSHSLDWHCNLFAQWIRGYLYEVAREVSLTYQARPTPTDLCRIMLSYD